METFICILARGLPTITCSVGTRSHRSREEWQVLCDTAENERNWRNMDSESQERVLAGVRKGLEQLLETIPEWVPSGFKGQSGETLDVTFHLMLAEQIPSMKS